MNTTKLLNELYKMLWLKRFINKQAKKIKLANKENSKLDPVKIFFEEVKDHIKNFINNRKYTVTDYILKSTKKNPGDLVLLRDLNKNDVFKFTSFGSDNAYKIILPMKRTEYMFEYEIKVKDNNNPNSDALFFDVASDEEVILIEKNWDAKLYEVEYFESEIKDSIETIADAIIEQL